MISPNAKGGSLALDMIHEGYAFRAEPSARQRTQPSGPRPSKAASHDSGSWYGVELEAQELNSPKPIVDPDAVLCEARGEFALLVRSRATVGQRTDCTCLRLGFLAFTVVI
jgi:hypothetical protein